MYVALMLFFRILTIVLVVLSTSFSGTWAAADGPSGDLRVEGGERHVMALMVAADPYECCEENMERSANCHLFPAIIPVTAADGPSRGRAQSFTMGATTMPDGTDPDGPLDPPRAV